ncbi:DUF4189 domain-containing protein [Mycolicibacterium moriokaense]|nr:DUF4189 domain-containing protein [Mycolicibacterium moriokaense]
MDMATIQGSPRRRWATKAAGGMLIAAGAVVAASLGATAPAHAEDYTYLAIVYSPATGAYGWANGADTPANLYNAAMARCQNRGGTDCHLLVDYVNSCGALAVQVGHPDRYVTRGAPNRLKADFQVLTAAPGNYILMSHCSTGSDGIG